MLNHIIRYLKTFVRRKWRQVFHPTEINPTKQSSLDLPESTKTQEVPSNSPTIAKYTPNETDSESPSSKNTKVGKETDSDTLQSAPLEGNSTDTKSSEEGRHKDPSNNQDSKIKPLTTDYTKSGQELGSSQDDKVNKVDESIIPDGDGSKVSFSDPHDNISQKVDLTSVRLAEDHRSNQSKDTVDGISARPELDESPTELPKKAESPEDNARDENPSFSEYKRGQRKAPRNIGGRRNVPTRSKLPINERDPSTFTPRPELICRKDSEAWQWEVVFSADEECDIVEVRHNGKKLDSVHNEYHLTSYVGGMSAVYESGEQYELRLFYDAPIVFKMSNDWNGDGRRVGGITSGHFIVIVPREWKRTGIAPVEPEDCADTDFKAHFFYVEKGDLAGDSLGFEGYNCALTASGFKLIGDRVFDDCEDGELFVGTPPRLCPSSGVVWARIGEERRGGWSGENFKPAKQSIADILNCRQGRFFVRVYDGESRLLDSGEFRYLRDLQEIRVNDELYSEKTLLVPPSSGYLPVRIQFISTNGTTVQPILDSAAICASPQSGDTLIVAAHPDGDCISCTLQSGTDSVNTVIKLPRIWWRKELNNGKSDGWRDMALAMTRHVFRELSVSNATIRLRLPIRISSIRAGFDEDLDRTYVLQKNENVTETEIHLSDFVDVDQFDKKLNEDALLNVEYGANLITLIHVSADPVPVVVSFTAEPATVTAGEKVKLHWATQSTDAVTVEINPGIGLVESSGYRSVEPAETTTYTLKLNAPGFETTTQTIIVAVHPRSNRDEKLSARVKYKGKGWRRGKGFSRGELRAVELTILDAAHRSIPIDRRRRSIHGDNIDTIRKSVNG